MIATFDRLCTQAAMATHMQYQIGARVASIMILLFVSAQAAPPACDRWGPRVDCGEPNSSHVGVGEISDEHKQD